jgi:perosamine synthetase
MGSTIRGKTVGSFGDIAFFSFNRGKNLSVCGGGCITTDDEELSEAIGRTIKNMDITGNRFDPAALFKTMAFSIAVNPYVYGAFYPAISRFKETAPPLDFPVGGINGFHAALDLGIIKRFDLMISKRHENGMLLMSGLKGLEGALVPEIRGADKPAFNRFPIVFKVRGARDLAAERLWRSGIESSRMYVRPLHHMFDLGYAYEDFSNACYVAQRLLTLPVHPSISRESLIKAVDVIRGILK